MNSVVKPDCTSDESNEYHPVANLNQLAEGSLTVAHENREAYDELFNAFKVAEQDIKEAEIVDKAGNGILIPAINELRYCSYHIIHAINSADPANQKEQLLRAKRHCERASFDALELGLSTLLIKIDEFKAPYRGKVPLSSVISGYADDMSAATKAQESLGGNYKDKIENFKAIREHHSRAKDIYVKFIQMEDDLQLEIDKRRRESRAQKVPYIALV
ncbi:MAG: hypothetical protein ACPHN3_07755, partial [Spongiibacter sp.]